MRAARAAGRLSDQRDDAVTLLEWERQGWTYHAKGSPISLAPHGRSHRAGIWLSPSKDSPPMLTMFGSTNLNSRSANFDTELSFVMVTSSQALQQTLHDEVRNLRRWAGPWKGADRTVRLRTKAIVGLVGGML
jgi:CDP-diacylglycerol--glycerol-3-phosphate 3-phosphatidyltransferase